MKNGGMRVSDIMDKKLVAIAPSTTIKSAIKLLQASNVDLLPIVSSGKLVGIVREDEILTYMVSHNEEDLEKKIEVISNDPVFVEEDENIANAVKKTVNHHLTRIPVVESSKSMRCVGIVSSTDLLKGITK